MMQSPPPTHPIKLPAWLARLLATFGGAGLFLVTFLDSSVLSFPVVADLIVMEEAMRKPALMPYYAAMATAGSLAGCLWLYWLAKKGGEAYFHRHAGGRGAKIRHWVERYAFWSILIPSMMPPPVPFKIFVIAAGVFLMPVRVFILALLIGRGLRYGLEGALAIRYGDAAIGFLLAHRWEVIAGTVAAVAAIYLMGRFIFSADGERE
jgi:membrane protein YqaA with SNARE-associated domain